MKAILFDLDGTLVVWDKVESTALQAVSEFLVSKHPQSQINDVCYTLGAILLKVKEDLNCGKTSLSDLTYEVIDALQSIGIAADVGELVIPAFLDNLVRQTKPYEDWHLLKSLKKRFKLGVITNGPSDLQRRKIESCGFDELFDLILCSADIGICKPDPMIFVEAADRLGVSLEECLMVGNNVHKDVIASSKLGMRAVLLLRDNKKVECELWKGPCINSLDALPSVLKDVEQEVLGF